MHCTLFLRVLILQRPPSPMIKFYFTTALKNLWAKKFYSFLSVVSLCIGLISFFSIYKAVQFHVSFDKFHKKSQQVFRLLCNTRINDDYYVENIIPEGLPAALREKFPQALSV